MPDKKFKNPLLNNQYRKPACHTDYCFQRMACCNNYRCCVCHCCLKQYAIYDKVRNTCTSNSSNSESLRTTPKGSTVTRISTIPITTSTKMKKITKAEVPTQQKATTRKSMKKDDHLYSYTEHVITHGKYPKYPTTGTTAATIATMISSTPRIFKTPRPARNIGKQQQTRDDKTSTIAGVVVALALVAIVAIVVFIVMCSKRKKQRKQNQRKKTNEGENDDGGVVTIPLNMENIEDSFRDTEEATTSDTTIDSPINIVNHEANAIDCNGITGNHLTPNYPLKGSKSSHRKHRKARDGKSGRRYEQKPLYADTGFNCNGSTRSDMTYSSSDSGGSKISDRKATEKAHMELHDEGCMYHQSQRSLDSNHLHQAAETCRDDQNAYETFGCDGKNGKIFDHCMNVMKYEEQVGNHQIGLSV